MSSPQTPWTLHLGLCDQGLTILKDKEIEQAVDPQVKHSHRKKQAVLAPLLVGTDTAAAWHRHQGHLNLGPFLLHTVPGT